jgi:hypothetical protein
VLVVVFFGRGAESIRSRNYIALHGIAEEQILEAIKKDEPTIDEAQMTIA